VAYHRKQLAWFTDFCKGNFNNTAVVLMDGEMERIVQDVKICRHISPAAYDRVVQYARANMEQVLVPHWKEHAWIAKLGTESEQLWSLRTLLKDGRFPYEKYPQGHF